MAGKFIFQTTGLVCETKKLEEAFSGGKKKVEILMFEYHDTILESCFWAWLEVALYLRD